MILKIRFLKKLITKQTSCEIICWKCRPKNQTLQKNKPEISEDVRKFRLILRMASCFSSPGTYSLPPIYVLSDISRLTEWLEKKAFPQVMVKQIKSSTCFDKDPAVREDFHEVLSKVQIAVADSNLLAETHAFMPQLKWAHSTWAGVESLIKAIPKKPEFVVTRHSGQAFTSLIAEYVVCHILNCERSFKSCWENQNSKTWIPSSFFTNFRLLNELNVGILGVGNMASGIAKFLKSRDTTVFGFARLPRPCGARFFDRIYHDLDEILPLCDYVCNTLPSTPLTIGMLNNSVLEKCKKKPVFINVGRGSIISEQELIKALRNKWLSGAILDVFEEEPLPETSELWKMPEVVITPHIAAISKPEHIAEEFFENLIKYIDGHGLQNIVDWSAGY